MQYFIHSVSDPRSYVWWWYSNNETFHRILVLSRLLFVIRGLVAGLAEWTFDDVR